MKGNKKNGIEGKIEDKNRFNILSGDKIDEKINMYIL